MRLRVRNSRSKDPQRPDLYRLWVDPEKNYLSLTSEMSVFEGGDIHGKIAFVDTYTLSDFARSPSGFWYPTRVVRKTSNFEVSRSLGSPSTSRSDPRQPL